MNGECFNMNVFIVVYCMLLLLLYIKVMNVLIGKWVVVKVNDCGLFKCGCVFDLLYVVVKVIGFVYVGMGCVKIEGLLL